jgi:hypothetical protein
MLIAAPQIARLVQRPARWAQRRVIDGSFGPIIARRGRALLVDLAAVEARVGINFSPSQLAAVGLRIPMIENCIEDDVPDVDGYKTITHGKHQVAYRADCGRDVALKALRRVVEREAEPEESA